MFDDKTRKGPSSTLISKPTAKPTATPTTMKPKPKGDIVEPEIDIENVPILQGSFEVTKTDADLTEKKVRTSTLKPFTITNGGMRMKPKKTTVEKVKPLPKVPENLTASILKLENVTRPIHYEKVTTYRPITTTDDALPTTHIEVEIRTSSELASAPSSTPSSTSISYDTEISTSTPSTTSTSTTTTTTTPPPPTTTEKIFAPAAVPNEQPVFSTSSPKPVIDDGATLVGEIFPETSKRNITYPSSIVLDDQPWLPIQPNAKPIELSDAKKKIHNSVNPPAVSPSYNTDSTGFQALPRNKVRNPSTNSAQKTSRPPIYHGFNNPALIYGLQEIERLGGSYVKPFPLPVDLIGDQLNKKDDHFALNKGEVLPSIKDSSNQPMETTMVKLTTTPAYEKINENSKPDGSITLNIEETTEHMKNKTQSQPDDNATDEQVGEILFDLLKESNMKFNDTRHPEEPLLQSRTDDLDLPDVQNQTEEVLLTDEIDHTEAYDEMATVLSSMETLSFKNIKDYIMATTKSITKDILSSVTTDIPTAPRKEKPHHGVEPAIKSDRIGVLPIPTIPAIVPRDRTTPPPTPSPPQASTTQPSARIPSSSSIPSGSQYSSEEVMFEPVTSSFVEIETVQYTPGSSWSPGLFPVQSKWEVINGSLVYPNVPPMRKVFNDTLKAWIIENPTEATELKQRIPPTELVRNSSEPIKNISTIFDTLASKLSINANENVKLPPFMSHFSSKYKTDSHAATSSSQNDTMPTAAAKKPTTTTLSPPPSTSATASDDELPVLLDQNTESYDEASIDALVDQMVGQAEVEEVDPTQYEQMLLIDRVSSALRPSSTVPPLVTLLPVKSNSGLRPAFVNEKMKNNNGRGFPAAAATASAQPTSNRRRFEDTSFVVRTSMSISS